MMGPPKTCVWLLLSFRAAPLLSVLPVLLPVPVLHLPVLVTYRIVNSSVVFHP